MDSSIQLAQRILATNAQRDGGVVSHLKLQKLLFYCYGAALAHGESQGEVEFHRWPHGPVCPTIYERFRSYGSAPIPCEDDSKLLEGAALSAFRVYSKLTAWQLREESHREAPWQFDELRRRIPNRQIESHFRQKFCTGHVRAPSLLPGARSLELDGLPGFNARTLDELANLVDG